MWKFSASHHLACLGDLADATGSFCGDSTPHPTESGAMAKAE